MIDSEQLYERIKTPLKNTASFDFYEVGLNDLLKRKFGELNVKNAINSYTYDLKQILECKELKYMIRMVFALAKNLNALRDLLGEEDDLPDIAFFYKNLSPVFLSAVYQTISDDHADEDVISNLTSALKIAIEQEYYFWQEKLVEM